MVNPNNLPALDDVKYRLKGLQIRPVVCTEDDFQHFMESVYADISRNTLDAEEEASQMSFIDSEVDLSTLDVMREAAAEGEAADIDLARASEDAPIIFLANQVVAKAIRKKCSDIHIEPQEDELVVRYRLDGVMLVDRRLPRAIIPALVSRYKVMANLDIAERRVPQDGRIRVKFSGKEIDFRVSTVPGKYGEKVVMRILDSSNTTLGLDKLVTDKNALDNFRDMFTSLMALFLLPVQQAPAKAHHFIRHWLN